MIELFESVSDLHIRRFMEPTWNKYPHWEHNTWDSLLIFLSGYAFERQGSSPSFPYAAVEVISDLQGKALTHGTVKQAWDSFAKKLNDRKLNHKNNPLCPKDKGYKDKKGRKKVSGISIIELLLSDPLGGKSLISWATERIESDDIKNAYNLLKEVNGIGNKIAPLFLRDVAVYTVKNLSVTITKDRKLLQPIDTWVKFVVRELSGSKLSDSKCAQYIVDNSEQPELVNQGIWYFCTQIAHSSRFLVSKGLHESEFRKLFRAHIYDLQKGCKITNDYRDKWISLV